MDPLQRVGIDVSAKTLVVVLEWEGRTTNLEVPNTRSGHRKLVRRLSQKLRTTRVALEATGVYSLAVALALEEAPGIQVMVVNPKAAAHFAKACLQRSKTDRLDAAVLLEFVRRMDFIPWQPPSAERLELRALSRRIVGLQKTKTQEKNRLHATEAALVLPATVCQDLRDHIAYLEGRIERLKALTLELIGRHPDLQQTFETLLSVKGIGIASGIQLLAEISLLPQGLSPRQWVAHAGLDPQHTVSGTSVLQPAHISKAGNVYLRRALFMPALVATRYEPHVRALYQHLQNRGKKPMQALVAVMRKLLHAIHAMLRDHQPFQGEKFYKIPAHNG